MDQNDILAWLELKKQLGDQVAVISLMSGSGCPVDEAEAGWIDTLEE